MTAKSYTVISPKPGPFFFLLLFQYFMGAGKTIFWRIPAQQIKEVLVGKRGAGDVSGFSYEKTIGPFAHRCGALVNAVKKNPPFQTYVGAQCYCSKLRARITQPIFP